MGRFGLKEITPGRAKQNAYQARRFQGDNVQGARHFPRMILNLTNR